MAVMFSPQVVAEGHKAHSSCQSSGVKEMGSSSCGRQIASQVCCQVTVGMPPSLCHSKSLSPRSRTKELYMFMPRCNFKNLNPNLVSKSDFRTSAKCWWLTFKRLFILVRALRLQRPSVVVAVNFLVIIGVISTSSTQRAVKCGYGACYIVTQWVPTCCVIL